MLGILGMAAGAIGGLVTGACSMVTGIIGGVFGGGFMGIVTTVVLNQALGLVFKKLFSTEDDEEIREMGDRVIQGTEQGIEMEDYETFEEYEAALKGIELNPERSKNIKQEEKEVAGMAFYMKELEIKYDFGVEGLAELLDKNKGLEESEKLGELVNVIKEEGFSETDVINFYKGKLSEEDMDRFENILINVLEN